MIKNNQDIDLNDNKLTNVNSITVIRIPTLENEVANKENIDDELDKNTISKIDQWLQNYLKVSVGNDTYKLTKYNKIRITDTTFIEYPSSGGYLHQN